MRVVHEPADGGGDQFPDGDRRVLATDVEVADSFASKLRGLMFRSSIPEDYALVFPLGSAGTQSVHMLFVRFPIDVVWTVDDEVTTVKTLSAWTGIGWGEGDRFLELPAGAAEGVQPGDTVRVEDQ